MKIMMAEDDRNISSIVEKYLKKSEYETVICENGTEALQKFDSSVNLVILDIMMPEIDGFSVLEEIRKISDVPVIMLTAKSSESDKIKGFDYGADDYVLKPFSPRELIKRIEVHIKRYYGTQQKSKISEYRDLKYDHIRNTVMKNDEIIDMTQTELKIMKVFFENKGIIIKREILTEKVFGIDSENYDRAVDTHIKRLRKKIEEDTKNPVYIKTKYGVGYQFGDKND